MASLSFLIGGVFLAALWWWWSEDNDLNSVRQPCGSVLCSRDSAVDALTLVGRRCGGFEVVGDPVAIAPA